MSRPDWEKFMGSESMRNYLPWIKPWMQEFVDAFKAEEKEGAEACLACAEYGQYQPLVRVTDAMTECETLVCPNCETVP